MSAAMQRHVRYTANILGGDGSRSVVQSAGDPIQAASVSEANAQAGPTSAASTSLYLGVGSGVGGVIFVACVAVVVLIVRKRAAHRRALAALEQGHANEVAEIQRTSIGDVPRPVSVARKGNLLPVHAKGGWGILGSSEEIIEPDLANHPSRKKRSSVSLPKRIKQRGIPLKRLKYLSAIIESPRSRSTKSPEPGQAPPSELRIGKTRSSGIIGQAQTTDWAVSTDEDVFLSPESPKPHVLPSFAIKSPGRYGASFVAEDNPKAMRSKSVGAFVNPVPEDAVFGDVSRRQRPGMHARSISLGAGRLPSLPPSGPVPPLPVIAPHDLKANDARQGVCISRLSSSSDGSSASSVLVTSPLLRGPEEGQAIGSPSVEQLIAEDDNASLKTVSQRQWSDPRVVGSRRVVDDSPTVPSSVTMGHTASVRSKVVRYSTDSQLSRHLSSASSSSSLENSNPNRLSIPKIGTADRMSISRISSTSSFKSEPGIRKVITPRRVSRAPTVSESGSPAERKKVHVLRDISGNAGLPPRQASSATQDSARSSNGNPFQWDSAPLQKPSALKGSPNARKGHRRQNCVRISTLTPQVLGPPPRRPTSPAMNGIEEQCNDDEQYQQKQRNLGGLPFVPSHQRLSRPPSAAFSPSLRIQTLRASLTPSSPTLSAWTAYQEHCLPSQPSDSQSSATALSTSASPGTAITRSASRQSGRSSNFSIPTFPSPSKTTTTAVQLDQPVPEFYFTRPSTDEASPGADRSPPFVLDMSDPVDIPSSPPLPSCKESEYDPTMPWLSMPTRTGSQEYGPASPVFANATTAEPTVSSPLQASTVSLSDVEYSPHSRPVSMATEDRPDSPLCSPKTVPDGFHGFFPPQPEECGTRSSTPRAMLQPVAEEEELTSANASTLMARLPATKAPPSKHPFDSASAPVLSPPTDDANIPFVPRARLTSTAAFHPSPQPPSPSNGACMPSPLNPQPRQTSSNSPRQRQSSLSPLGPRSAPVKSVLKNALALRRMNSEMDTSAEHHRASRRYLNGLVREPSPLLPFIGSPDPDTAEGDGYGCNELFDFDFGHSSDTDAGAASALDNVDLDDFERRLERALAGFDAPPRSSGELSNCATPPKQPGMSDPEEEDAAAWASHPHYQAHLQQSRNSSVWEDGEKYWQRTSLSTIPGSSPESGRKLDTPRSAANVGLEISDWGSWAHYRNGGGSIMATPRSLYDAEGFLKT